MRSECNTIEPLSNLILTGNLRDVYLRIQSGEKADTDSLIEAIDQDDEGIAMYLIDHGAEPNDYCFAMAYFEGMVDLIDKMINAKNNPVFYSSSTLCFLIRQSAVNNEGDEDILVEKINFLIHLGVPADTQCLNTALERYIETGNHVFCEAVKYCLESGARPDNNSTYEMQKKLTSSAESLLLKCLIQEAYFPTVKLLNRVMKRIILSRPINSLMTQWMENVKRIIDTGVNPDIESIESLLEISKMFSQAN